MTIAKGWAKHPSLRPAARNALTVKGPGKPRCFQPVVHQHCKAAKTSPVVSTGQVRHRLIMRSKLPAAEQFEEWVVGTVLPALRRNGGYVVGQERLETGRSALHPP